MSKSSYSRFKDAEEVINDGFVKEILEDIMTTMHSAIFAKDFADEISSVINLFQVGFWLEFLDYFLEDFASSLLY